jgi:hypothetical protein
MIRRVALVLAATVAASAGVESGAVRADEKTCVIDQVSGLLHCTLIASPAPPRRVRLSEELPLEWIRVSMNVDELIARGIGCVRDVPGGVEIGVGYAIALNNTATGEQLYLDFVCTWPGEPPPQPPPAPPTPGELAAANAQVLMLEPSLSPTPAIGGLTGLDSWLWCADPGPVGTGVSLRGWTAGGSVQLVQLGWEIGTDVLAQTSTSCGSQDAPSVTWTPEAVGEYPITLTSVWAGSWELTWNGIPMGTFPLGPVSLTSPPQPYPVDEYRGELTG